MKLLLVRHGEPDYSIDSLTPKGWREADLLAERLAKIAEPVFYSSPLGRAKDTAAATLRTVAKEATVLPWLQEFPGYILDAKTGERRICWDLYPDEWTADPRHFDRTRWCETPLMQSGDVPLRYAEVCNGLDALLAEHGCVHTGLFFEMTRESHETLVLFCHFGVTCVILSHLLNLSPMVLWQGMVAAPSSVTTLVTEERRKGVASMRCISFGDQSHLYAGGEPASFAARFCECFSDPERH